MWGGLRTRSMSYDPALAEQPGILFSTFVREPDPNSPSAIPVLAQLAMGCSNPLFASYMSLSYLCYRISHHMHGILRMSACKFCRLHRG